MEQLVIAPLPLRRRRCLSARRRWRVVRPWYFCLDDGIDYVIPAGFVFDGASVPPVLKPFRDATGTLLHAALVHDFGYAHHGLRAVGGRMRPLSRREVDAIFLAQSRDRVAYALVRLFGGRYWRRGVSVYDSGSFTYSVGSRRSR